MTKVISVASTIFFRFLVGPLCDKYGAKINYVILLFSGAIATFGMAFVNSPISLMVTQSFVGILGATFVTCEYWASSMFNERIVGTANAITAGFGNVGAGVVSVMNKNIFADLKAHGVDPS
jgi:NNP family nitrate/nitrite transporter-like MFS transporter